jgi:hypothetical protein
VYGGTANSVFGKLNPVLESGYKPLMDAELDLLGAMALSNGLVKAMGMELPGTLGFDFPSVGTWLA